MPCHYTVVSELQLVVTTCWGRVTFAEAKAHQDQLKSDPAFRPEFSQLFELDRVTDFALSLEEAKLLASGSNFFSASSRRAWVSSDPVIFGMGRLMEAYSEMAGSQAQTSVFSDRTEALKWLGLNVRPQAWPAIG
jgi:hypothetical protein